MPTVTIHFQPVVERPEPTILPAEIKIALGKYLFAQEADRGAHLTEYDGMWPDTERCLTQYDVRFLEGLRDGFYTSRRDVSQGIQKLIEAIGKYGTVQVWTKTERDPTEIMPAKPKGPVS